MSLSSDIKALALDLGFDSVGITSAADLLDAERAMLDAVRSGRMSAFPWFTEDRAGVSCRPTALFGGAQSVISVSARYSEASPSRLQPGEPIGVFARYAWGDDYHTIMRARLIRLRELIGKLVGRPVGGQAYVDAARVAERALAQRAGTGWMGKSANLISSRGGSWVLLGELMLDVDLEPDVPAASKCGRCVACISACPTGAIVAPHLVDARRCISALTIELRGAIPVDLRPLISNRVFGCDVCQEVCPHNHRRRGGCWDEFRPRPGMAGGLPLRGLVLLSEPDYQRTFARSAVKRAKRNGLRRNALVAAGNSGDTGLVGVVATALDDGDPLIRSHAAWALGRIGGAPARLALEVSRAREADPAVRGEIDAALQRSEA